MKILCMSEKKCVCCGKNSKQAVYSTNLDFESQSASLTGIDDSSKLWRGIEVCEHCYFAAPDIEQDIAGIKGKQILGLMGTENYQNCLNARSVNKRATTKSSNATRWLAYAQTFSEFLSPEEAGYAWLHALAELENPDLCRAGEAKDDLIDAESKMVDLARNNSNYYLSRVVNSEFYTHWFFALIKPFKRIYIGERAFRAGKIGIDEKFSLFNHKNIQPAQTAAALVDVLRCTGEWEKAAKVASNALKRKLPQSLRKVLEFQQALIKEKTSRHFIVKNITVTQLAPVLSKSDTREFNHRELAFG